MKTILSLMLAGILCLSVTICGAESAGSPLIVENGMMQPFLKWSDLRAERYTNEGSDILRFCVWVETDQDTDADGKADLVKAFIQVPRPAVEGRYRAAVIYDPTPYVVGVLDRYDDHCDDLYVKEPFDYQLLYSAGEKRTPAGEMSTMEAALKAEPTQWNYVPPATDSPGYYNSNEYDYYLLRGFAVVLAAGIGTYGSEGFELCGMDLERDSHKNVIEWLTGDRKAYTDRTSNIEIRADWCNGCVAMTGASYGGALPFAVATSGVNGLKTIIPYAGIASWYDYTNSQGVTIINNVHYADNLASYNCGGCFTVEALTRLKPGYGAWLWQITQDQDETNGDYAPVWELLDYTRPEVNHIRCSALVVNGMNDTNVTTRNADQMVRAFQKAGQTVKLVLHQNGHTNLDDQLVFGQPWQELVNKWLSHYLYGVQNDAETLPAVLAQSNIDGSYRAYDSWADFQYLDIRPESGEAQTTVASNGMGKYTGEYEENTQNNLTVEEQERFYARMEAPLKAVYRIELPDNTTIFGVPEVHLKLSSPDDDRDGLMITALLMDVSDRGTFPAYRVHGQENPLVNTESTDMTFRMGGGLEDRVIQRFVQEEVPMQLVSIGWTDLQNPGMGFDASEYVLQEVGLEAGVAKDYTFYLQPTAYTMAEGHHLELYLMTWDPYRVFLDESFNLDASQETDYINYNYSFTIDHSSLLVRIPVA